MFTGIIEDLGTVVGVEALSTAARLTLSGTVLDDVQPGDSVAVNGVCLTATAIGPTSFTADVMNETLSRSTLGALRPGERVNLERAVLPTTRLGGHIVQGHVDGVGTVTARRSDEHWDVVHIALPADLVKYVVMKGSIALDGVSLTVASLDGAGVGVSLIPETLARTTLGLRQVGGTVNIEVDVLAKYVEQLLVNVAGAPDPGNGGRA
jgi:riboflavin synthase